MSESSWDSYHHRAALVRRVTEVADRRRDGLLPWAEVRGIAEVFPEPEDLLLALHGRWATALLARLDEVLEQTAADPRTAVVTALRDLAWDMPGTAAILDAHADNPRLCVARDKLVALVSRAAGADMSAELGCLADLPRPVVTPKQSLMSRLMARCPLHARAAASV